MSEPAKPIEIISIHDLLSAAKPLYGSHIGEAVGYFVDNRALAKSGLYYPEPAVMASLSL